MFMRAEWRIGDVPTERQGRIKTAVGIARWRLQLQNDKAFLSIDLEPRGPETVVSARTNTALGGLALLQNALPRFTGSNTVIQVCALSRDWLDAREDVLVLLGSAGLSVRIKERVLEIAGTGAPAELLRRLGIALVALDIESRRAMSERELNAVRLDCVRLLGDDSQHILEFLDDYDGERRVRDLLGGLNHAQNFRAREGRIVEIIGKLQPWELVHFHCASGRLLRRIAESPQIRIQELSGVEPSLIRIARVLLKLDGCFSVQHGSIIEPPCNLSSEALALLVDALPAVTDIRLERAAEVLCRERGFQWVLCVESLESSASLARFARACSDTYGYRAGTWTSGSDTVLLLRRKTAPQVVPDQTCRIRAIETRLARRIQLQPPQWASTLEAFSLRTVDPRWLIYLPSGLASIQNERPDGLLEHPAEAFEYYRREAVSRVIVETKHMGSRAIAVICRNTDAAKERFGLEEPGSIYTRNGRPFFKAGDYEFLRALQDGLSRARFWERFKTDWVCLDGEILPWSVKAERLISDNHREMLETSEAILAEMKLAPSYGQFSSENLERKRNGLQRYRELLEKYEGEASSPIRFAPFHLIATEGRAYFDKTHHWHMLTLNALANRAGEPFLKTSFRLVNLDDSTQIAEVFEWWDRISIAGEEGLVIKPLHFLCRGRRGLAQPGIKCRGREHLRLVYGPEYDLQENMVALLDRPAVARRRQKHRRILRQLALSVEAVERFVRKEPLSRVEECVRAVLSLETRENVGAVALSGDLTHR